MWLIYQALMALALVLAGPFLLLSRGRHYLATLGGRLGLGGGPAGSAGGAAGSAGALWFHAVSVGEVGVAATLLRRLPAALPLLVTTVTPTGQERARAAFRGRATVAYLPFELGFAVERFLARSRPRALVLVEGDYWPLLLRAARRRGLPTAVINGRLSDRSFPRLRRFRALLGPLLDPIDRFGVQTALDRDRLLALGVAAERVVVTGNLKFETAEPPELPELGAELARLADGRPLLVAGSTMAGEEEVVLAAAARLGADRACLLLAPRHPERWEGVARLLGERLPGSVRRSAWSTARRPPAILLDSMGELASAFRSAACAFIGGTLVSTGGHNPLEAARFGVPVAVGPSMENFREIAAAFDGAAAWRRVRDGEELAAAWRSWLDDPAAGRALGARGAALITANQGALDRTLELLAPLLTSLAAPAAPATASAAERSAALSVGGPPHGG